MNLRQLFRPNREKKTASIAKERLQILVAHERAQRNGHDFLPDMQKDILKVVQKYIQADHDTINISLDRQDSYSVLEVNVQLPEQQ